MYCSLPCIFSLPQDIDRNQKVTDMNGKEYFLVDVIAHILHDLKCRLLTVVRDFGYQELNASDFDWVITVPAFWKDEGRKMMREAGYMVSPNIKLQLCNMWRGSVICTCTRTRHQIFRKTFDPCNNAESMNIFCLSIQWKICYHIT